MSRDSLKYMDQVEVGSIVVFDMGTFPNIGIITRIFEENGRLLCTIMHPSGRIRERDLEFDYNDCALRPLLGSYNTCIRSDAWDEWFKSHKHK